MGLMWAAPLSCPSEKLIGHDANKEAGQAARGRPGAPPVPLAGAGQYMWRTPRLDGWTWAQIDLFCGAHLNSN